MLRTILLFTIASLVVSHPTKQRDSIAKLNAELDKNEISIPITISFVKNASTLRDMAIKAGSVFEVKCEAAGVPPPLFYWTFNGKKIQSYGEMNLFEKLQNIGKTTIQHGVTVSKIYIPCFQKENVGQYKCVASNGHSKIEKSAYIELDDESDSSEETMIPCEKREPEGPKIVQWSDTRFENENNAAQIICRANSPSATIAWYDGDRKLLNNDPNFEVFSNGDLMIKKGSWESMGVYICVASNEFGEDRIETFFYPTAAK